MALKWKKEDLKTLAQKKMDMANEACEAAIYAGMDVELTNGTEHFSFETKDQINISNMMKAVQMGATKYAYHKDSGETVSDCIMYSAVDIVKIYVACETCVTYQTTYCNKLKKWIEREQDKNVLASITYGSALPSDLQAELQEIMDDTQEEVQRILANITQQAAGGGNA